jgi:hypothetical protein
MKNPISSLKDWLLTIITIKELVMGMKEDFATFKAAVDGALTEIQADIEALKIAVEAAASEAGTTPPEVAAQMAEITAKLEAIRNIYNPTSGAPEEPL